MSCNCVIKVDALLEKRNAELRVNPLGEPRALVVVVRKYENKKRAALPLLQASYCPFCGVAYDETAPNDPAGPKPKRLDANG